MKVWFATSVLFLTFGSGPFAQTTDSEAANTQQGEPLITDASLDSAAAREEDPPSESPETDEATADELQGKLDSFGEAFTELKNVVDVLNRMKLSGYLQAQYVHDETSVNELTSATTTRNRDQFSVRRGRIKFTYQAAPTARLVLQPDITTSGVTLKDGYVEFTEPWTSWKNTLTAGQFNWPFGFEVMYSSSAREMPERSRVVRTLFPGERDRGAMLTGRGLDERLGYWAAIVNGTGTTQNFDFNKRKDFVGRLQYTVGPLDVGGSVYRGRDLVVTSERPTGVEFDKERQGIDVQLVTGIPGLGARGEYITGKERGAEVDGWYAYLIQNLGTRHQFAVRADDYDPNTDLSNSNATRSVLTLGGSYIFHWDGNSKVMLAWEHSETEDVEIDDDVLTVRYQYAF